MKGYKTQYSDFSSYVDCEGKRLDAVELADKLLTAHEHGAEIAALMMDVYRPEQLHSNGTLNDSYIPESMEHDGMRHNMADGTETRSCNASDLYDQAGHEGGLWDTLQEAYKGYIKNTRRWREGYKPEALKPDAAFSNKVKAAKLRMRKNRKHAAKLRNRAHELGII